jgi:formylglycine-generating enzyme required for sulfatase activity
VTALVGLLGATGSVAGGCLLFRDVDSLTSHPDAGSASEAGDGDGAMGDGSPDAGSDADRDSGPTCSGTAGPAGVRVGAYCIDSTEVTVRNYRAFLDARAGDVSGQSAACAWNTSFGPLYGLPGPEADDRPVTFVDFCDAAAYCAWAGKHLCHAISGAPLTTADVASAARSEWFRACARNDDGLHTFPYGNAYGPLRCNGADRDSGIVAAGSLPECEGGYPGIFDLAGNVREWEDACDEGATSTDRSCLARGGAFYDIGGTLACSNRQSMKVTEQNVGVGFRCCAP